MKIENHPLKYIKTDITAMDAKEKEIIGNSIKITMDGMIKRLGIILRPNEN